MASNVAITETYRDAMTIKEFMDGDELCKAGQYNKLGEYKIQAGEVLRLGFGANGSMEGSNGRIYLALKYNDGTTISDLDGKIRFMVHSPQGRPLRILAEYHTAQLRTDAVDRTKQVPFANFGPFLSEDKKLVIEYNPSGSADVTVTKADSVLLMDVTQGVVE